jgi:hypothetical protein
MRPRGEIREAIDMAAQRPELVDAVTFVDLACLARVGFSAAKSTCQDMAKAGDLVPVGTRQVPGIKRPLRTYKHRSRVQASADPLASALRCWVTSF